MKTARDFGGFIGAMTAFSPSLIIGGIHYTVSKLEGKDNKTASADFDNTFNRLFKLGEDVGATVAVEAVSLGKDIFGDKKEK